MSHVHASVFVSTKCMICLAGLQCIPALTCPLCVCLATCLAALDIPVCSGYSSTSFRKSFAPHFVCLTIRCFCVAHKANLNALNAEGLTPLHLAVQRWNVPIVQFLADQGADVLQPIAYG